MQVPPARWASQDCWANDPPPGVEPIEGFWVPRPWTASDSCPPPAANGPAVPSVEPVTLAGQTLAIAQLFARDGSRSGRREDKPYVAVVRAGLDQVRAERGFRRRLAGRLTAPDEGGAVHCRQPGGPEQRPICLVAVTLDEVAIENAGTGETIARWQGSGAGRAD